MIFKIPNVIPNCENGDNCTWTTIKKKKNLGYVSLNWACFPAILFSSGNSSVCVEWCFTCKWTALHSEGFHKQVKLVLKARCLKRQTTIYSRILKQISLDLSLFICIFKLFSLSLSLVTWKFIRQLTSYKLFLLLFDDESVLRFLLVFSYFWNSLCPWYPSELEKYYPFFKRLYLFIFRERGREGEREREMWMHPCVRETAVSCLLHTPQRDLACHPGMCPDWELNRWLVGLQDDAQSTESHQSGLLLIFEDSSHSSPLTGVFIN